MTARPAPPSETIGSAPSPREGASAGRRVATQLGATVAPSADGSVEGLARAGIPRLRQMGVETELLRARPGCLVVRSSARPPGDAAWACAVVGGWLEALPAVGFERTGTVAESSCATRGARACIHTLLWRAPDASVEAGSPPFWRSDPPDARVPPAPPTTSLPEAAEGRDADGSTARVPPASPLQAHASNGTNGHRPHASNGGDPTVGNGSSGDTCRRPVPSTERPAPPLADVAARPAPEPPPAPPAPTPRAPAAAVPAPAPVAPRVAAPPPAPARPTPPPPAPPRPAPAAPARPAAAGSPAGTRVPSSAGPPPPPPGPAPRAPAQPAPPAPALGPPVPARLPALMEHPPVAQVAPYRSPRSPWLRRRAWLLAVGLLAGTFGGYVARTHGGVSYSATAVLEVTSPGATTAASNAQGAAELAVTYAALIPNDAALLARVGSELHLAPSDVAHHLAVQAQSGTALIDVKFADTSAHASLAGANAVARALSSSAPPGQAIAAGSLTVVSRARAAARSGSLHKYGLPLGVLLGLAVGAGASLVAERADRRVDDLETLAAVAGCAATRAPGGISTAELARGLARVEGGAVTVVPLRLEQVAPAAELSRSLAAERPAKSPGGAHVLPRVTLARPLALSPDVDTGEGATVLVVARGERVAAVEEAADRLRLVGRDPALAVLVCPGPRPAPIEARTVHDAPRG